MVTSASATSLIAIDWGTSSLRAARLDTQGAMLEERAWPRGILTVPPGGFANAWREAVGDWTAAHPRAPCLIAGMAGSQQGWREAAYAPCPASLADLTRQRCRLSAADGLLADEQVAIVGGLCCEHDGVPDVMRGEETQVLGACALLGLRDATVVLPGTHSKWVDLRDGCIQGFHTWMSGEFYALLQQHSILARTLPDLQAPAAPFDETAFGQGVAQALRSTSLLASAFSVRSLSLFNRLPLDSRPAYLSGLVIGEELRAAPRHHRQRPMVLVGDATLVARYQSAMKQCQFDTLAIGSQATWRGLWEIAQHSPHAP